MASVSYTSNVLCRPELYHFTAKQYAIAQNTYLNRLQFYISSNCREDFFDTLNDLYILLCENYYGLTDRRNMVVLDLVVLASKAFSAANTILPLSIVEEIWMIGGSLDSPPDWAHAVIVIRKLFESLFDALSKKNVHYDNVLVPKLQNFIENHVKEDLSLARLGKELGYNASYLSSTYKRLTGQSLTDYINGVRLDHAKALLHNASSSIKDISAECGFESQQYFNRIFKKKAGMTPNEYRGQFTNLISISPSRPSTAITDDMENFDIDFDFDRIV